VPFYQQPGLGGQSTLRGYEFNRFQDDGALVVSAEYRYPIWMNLDAVVFTDAGQVFDGLRDVRGARFRWSYGGGVHLLNEDGLSFRAEVAAGPEGARAILTVQPSFRRVVR
jgi:outer membrane protein assembly factor BamA